VALFKNLVCKLLIEARLLFQLVENPSSQPLLFYVQPAPNISHILLPSADTAHSWMTEAFTSGMEKMTVLHTGRENTIVQSNFTNEILIISS
jgi:hypothetical protein